MARRFVTFLSDFGLEDGFVGVCHGVIKRIAPEVEIIDVTHGIGPQRVLQGALALADAVPYLPEGVHLAVVDPGVGTGRRGLVLRDPSGRLYVGPDNGLLIPAAERMGGIAAAHELTNRAYALSPVSRTFHGRDVFAPAAAHLALGVPLEELGAPVDLAGLVRLDLPEPEIAQGAIRAVVLAVDRFGNLGLNLAPGHLGRAGLARGGPVELEVGGRRYRAVVAETFADAQPGELVVYENSHGKVGVAVVRGSAAWTLSARSGDGLHLLACPRGPE